MRKTLLCLLGGALLGLNPAYADRPVTPEEQGAIEKVLFAEGCEGGMLEADEERGTLEGFDIDNAICANGELWDYTLSPTYAIVGKEIEDND